MIVVVLRGKHYFKPYWAKLIDHAARERGDAWLIRFKKQPARNGFIFGRHRSPTSRPCSAPPYDDSMNAQLLEQLAARLVAGQLSVPEFVGRVQDSGIADVGPAQVDLDRHRRCGFPEVVFSQGKTVEAIAKIFHAQLEHGVDVLATRMSTEQAAELLSQFPAARYNPIGRTFRIAQPPQDERPERRSAA